MKKTLIAAIMATASIAATAQTVPTNPPSTTPPTTTSPVTTPPSTTSPMTTPAMPTTTSPMTMPATPTTTSPITSPATPTTTSPMTTTPPTGINNGTTVTNSTSDPMKTVTNTPTNYTWTNTAPVTTGWNNYNTWYSPMPGTTLPANNSTMGNSSYPANNGSAAPMTGTTTYGNNASGSPVNNTATATATATDQQTPAQNMSSTGNYLAYGTANASLPANVNMAYSREYPTYAAMNQSWTQYGDWFYSSYMTNGRYTQVFYDNRGNGYSLALPVLLTYVPENIVDQAVKRYGTNLYSITMVKTGDGTKESYLINLIDRGQSRMEYVGDDGMTLTEVWRIDPPVVDSMTTTGTNAAMGTDDATTSSDASTSSDATMVGDGMKVKSDDEKTVIKDKYGNKTKVKVKGDGTIKIKEKKTDD